MVHYPAVKYVRPSTLRGLRPFRFRTEDKRADQVAAVATCLRCAQTIANQEKRCRRPESRRCEHCTDGNRGNCALVPVKFNGLVNRLYGLRRLYDAAITAAATPRTNAAVIAAGVKLARAQRQFNLELAYHRREAAHTGTPLGVPTQVPTSTPDFLSLILVEQRRIASALESLVGHVAVMNANVNPLDDDDVDVDDDDDDDEDPPANPNAGDGRGAAAAPDGRTGADGDENGGGDGPRDLDEVMNSS